MIDIIEIKINNPYFLPNYDYIVDRMENEGCIVVTDEQLKVLNIVKNIARRGYKYKMPRGEEGLWTVILEKPTDTEVNIDENAKRFKILEAGKEVTVKNRGQILTLNRIYRRKVPTGKKKIMQRPEKSGGYTIWLE